MNYLLPCFLLLNIANICCFGTAFLIESRLGLVPGNAILPSESLKAARYSDVQNNGHVTGTEDRREFFQSAIGAAAFSMVAIPSSPSVAADDIAYDVFKDKECGFQVKVPSNWEKSTQELGDRRKIVFFINPESGDDKDLIFIAYTSVRDDFTQLSSFGTVDEVAQSTILPKSDLAGESNESKMIFAESKGNSYYFDYTSQPAGQPMRHFRTIFSLYVGATGGAGAVLVTLTAQSLDKNYKGLKDTFDGVINSYGKLS